LSFTETVAADRSLGSYAEQFTHLRKAPDIVCEALREAILDGYLPAGTRLPEEELAQEFGVSRTPVREALQRLRVDGFVEFGPRQVASVTAITNDDILAIYFVREVLEGLAARLAALRATPDQHKKLLALVREMNEAADQGDPALTAELNLRFHAEMRRIAGNPYLDRFLTQIEHAVRRFGRTTYSYSGRSETTRAEHEAIVDAIVLRDPQRAEAVAAEHMRNARQLRLQMLMEGY
jgi:DNA-binding GntR family transcriptional regulator